MFPSALGCPAASTTGAEWSPWGLGRSSRATGTRLTKVRSIENISVMWKWALHYPVVPNFSPVTLLSQIAGIFFSLLMATELAPQGNEVPENGHFFSSQPWFVAAVGIHLQLLGAQQQWGHERLRRQTELERHWRTLCLGPVLHVPDEHWVRLRRLWLCQTGH